MRQDKHETFYNRSLERALQILSAFNHERQELTMTQLSEILNLPKATVLRLCSTLIKYNFLRYEPELKRYSLGFKLFELGSIVFHSLSLRRIASPYLDKLQMTLGKTIFLGIIENDELLYIDKREDPRNPISFTSKIGTRRPPYWGILGPVIMAYLPESEIERLLEKNPLKATTKKSFTQKGDFIKWLHKIKKQGYVIDVETALEGISGFASPIRDFTGNVIAGLGVGFISTSVDSKQLEKIAKEVIDAALSISSEMGYSQKKKKFSNLKSVRA